MQTKTEPVPMHHCVRLPFFKVCLFSVCGPCLPVQFLKPEGLFSQNMHFNVSISFFYFKCVNQPEEYFFLH